PDRTLFDGVRQVEPGELVVWEAGRAIARARWRAWGAAAAAAAAGVRVALDDAVRVRAVADAPVAVQLSGGVGSACVLALAARRRAVTAFTVAFDGGGEYDERARAEETAAALGVPLAVVALDARAIADAWPAAVAHGEGLAVNGHVAAKWALARDMRGAGCKV